MGSKVDGYNHSRKTIYRYNSCFLHGCTICYLPETKKPLSNFTMAILNERTVRRTNLLKEKGYIVIEMWSCKYNKVCRVSDKFKESISGFNIAPPLQPRDAFYGGRVDCCKTYYKVEEGADGHYKETIDYNDFTSLYPYINKYGIYPVGHHKKLGPEYWLGKKEYDIQNIEGLIKCTVLPPKRLYHPVLPYRYGGKLTFPLCRKCLEVAHELSEKHWESDSLYFKEYHSKFSGDGYVCNHKDNKRTLTGTWVSCELKKAIQMGYIITCIFEVWHYSHTSQYDSKTFEGGLFKNYVNTFLRLKQEKSGWPSWVKTGSDKEKYLASYYEKEGITLRPDEIEVNPGLRAVSKLILNSFWGKFGQRDNMNQSLYISDPEKYFKMLTDKTVEINDIRLVNDEMVFLEYKHKNEFVSPSNKINVVLAAYTTAQARLKLYGVLEALDRRVLYYDTGSVIFTTKICNGKPVEHKPYLGDLLGQLTNELETDIFIREFVSSGPKSYSYRYNKPNSQGILTECKVKGIRLNYSALEQVNFETMRDTVCGDLETRKQKSDGVNCQKIKITYSHQIVRNKKTTQIITRSMGKTFQCVYSKRVVQYNGDTLPFGF